VSPVATAHKFAALDGIRGLAAIFVMMRHTSSMWGFQLVHSHLAVDVFFLLSGFVIANSYEAKLADGRLSVGAFARVRLIRFYPMYLVALALCGGLTWMTGLIDGEPVRHAQVIGWGVLGLFFIPSAGANILPLLSVSWSLFYELLVNLLYAVVRPALSTRKLLAICAFAYVALVAAGARHGSLDMGWVGNALGVVEGLTRAVFGIFLGIALFRLRTRLWALLPQVPPLAAILVICALICAPSVGPTWILDVLAIPLLPPLVLMAARGEPPLARAMTFLGSASYPVYLLHVPAHLAIDLVVDVRPWTPWAGLAFAVGMVLLAVTAERAYDLPARRWLTAKLRPRVIPLKTT
jgi:peptidoglycan/LPS O-acetylase OafA/YrhL